MANRILPLELIDKAIGSQIWILMRGKTEIVGTLRGFDDYVSLLSETCAYLISIAIMATYNAYIFSLCRLILFWMMPLSILQRVTDLSRRS